MSAGEPQIPFTYEDYKALTASTDVRYELIDGDLLMVPAPTSTHQIVSKNLQFLLEGHVRASGCGLVLNAPLDVVLGKGAKRSVVQPDLIFISAERQHIVTEPEIVDAPDSVVEILSPSTAERDQVAKKTLYARSGVREYWIVDPAERCIDVFSLQGAGFGEPERYEGDQRAVSFVVPGFEAPLAEVFERR